MTVLHYSSIVVVHSFDPTEQNISLSLQNAKELHIKVQCGTAGYDTASAAIA
jgi:hypothetical protein